MATMLPLVWLKIGPGLSICFTKQTYMIQANTRAGTRIRQQRKAAGRFIDGCFGRKAKTIIISDDGVAFSSPYSLNVLMNAISRANARQLTGDNLRSTVRLKLYGFKNDIDEALLQQDGKVIESIFPQEEQSDDFFCDDEEDDELYDEDEQEE